MNHELRKFSRLGDQQLRRLVRSHMGNRGGKIYGKKAVLYVLVNPAWPHWIKIGFTQYPKIRLGLFNQGCPLKDYQLLRVVECSFYRTVEKEAIDLLKQAGKKPSHGEWIEATVDEAKKAVLDATKATYERKGIGVQWEKAS